MTEALASLQGQLAKMQEQSAQPPAPAPVAAAPAPAESADEIERREALARERIRKEREKLAEERRKLAEERERQHQEEVERHRRKLYPEYYAEKDKAKAAAAGTERAQAPAPAAEPPRQQARREISDDDIAEILREAALPDDEGAGEAQADKGDGEKKDDDVNAAIEYFKDDEYEIPVDVGGKSAKWRVPLD
jgi:hypothetical protein